MPNQRNRDLLRPLTSVTLLLAAGACSGETINLGENTSGLEAPVSSCPAPGNIIARNQADLDALAGCEVIEGDLAVVPFEGADLRPLASLREVRGGVDIGSVIVLGDRDVDPFALFALLDAGWLFSLEGLENLERVGYLAINGFSVDSLEPLSNLSALTTNGGIQLSRCGGVRDLSGLENVVGLQSLEINCTELESLSGLPFPDSMNTVILSGPALKDLGNFAVLNLQALLIGGSGLESLDGLERLQTAVSINISQNPELVDASALNSLQSVDFFNVADNTSLERLPELESVTRLGRLIVANNPVLQNVPSFPAILGDFLGLSSFGLSRRDLLIYRPDTIEIENNPALEQLVLPAGLQAAGLVEIQNNAALRSISFSDIAAVDFLSIANNAALDSVELGGLARVDDLVVAGNPALDLAVFDTLQTFSSELSVAPASAP